MIEKVEFRNFKALREVSLDLERLTVLVGPNASGKTSVLEGIHYLAQITSEPEAEEILGPDEFWDALVSRGSVPAVPMLATPYIPEEHRGWLTQSPPLMAFACVTNKGILAVLYEGHGSHNTFCADAIGEHWEISNSGLSESACARPGIGPAVLLRLDVTALIAPSYSDQAVPTIESDGMGLASVLAYMAANRPEDYTFVGDALRSVVPSVRAIRTPRARVVRVESEVMTVDGKKFTHRGEREYWGNSVEFDMDGAPQIPAHMASEGTMLVLGLLTVLVGPQRPNLLLLDDIDRVLHPKAQEDLVGLLRKVLAQNPDMQIVATSHSPYLLDHLKPEEVRLTTLKDDGSVAVGRLDRHPDFEKWKEEMTPGEFWSMVGERWVAEAGARE